MRLASLGAVQGSREARKRATQRWSNQVASWGYLDSLLGIKKYCSIARILFCRQPVNTLQSHRTLHLELASLDLCRPGPLMSAGIPLQYMNKARVCRPFSTFTSTLTCRDVQISAKTKHETMCLYTCMCMHTCVLHTCMCTTHICLCVCVCVHVVHACVCESKY